MSHLCALRRQKGWAAGFLTDKLPDNWINVLAGTSRPVLAVIDYAESRGNLHTMLSMLLEQDYAWKNKKIRIVLLARNREEWWDNLKRKSDAINVFMEETLPEQIPPLAADAKSRTEIYCQAGKAFAHVLEKEEPAYVPDLADSRFDSVLYLHMAALLHVTDRNSVDPGGLMDSILNHEERFWQKDSAGASSISGDSWTRKKAYPFIAAAILKGGFVTEKSAENTASWLEFSDADLHRFHLIYEYAGCNTGAADARYIDALRPDLLGEAMLKRFIQQYDMERIDEFIENVFKEKKPEEMFSAFEILGRVSSKPDYTSIDQTKYKEAIRSWINSILYTDVPRACISAYIAALAIAQKSAFSHLADILSEFLEKKNPVETAETLYSIGLPDFSLSLNHISYWVTKAMLENIHPGDEEKRALYLNNLGNRQSAVGLKKDALVSAQESVDIRRKLAEKMPDAFLPDLAMSLNNLGNRQSDVGLKEDALVSAQEAIDIYWPFFEKYPMAFLREVIIVLNNIIRYFKELGIDPDKALITRIQYAIEVMKDLESSGADSSSM